MIARRRLRMTWESSTKDNVRKLFGSILCFKQRAYSGRESETVSLAVYLVRRTLRESCYRLCRQPGLQPGGWVACMCSDLGSDHVLRGACERMCLSRRPVHSTERASETTYHQLYTTSNHVNLQLQIDGGSRLFCLLNLTSIFVTIIANFTTICLLLSG